MAARRLATVATATALAAGPAVLAGAGSAHATTDHGRASAVVLRTGLDVSLLNKTVNVPLAVSLNEVQAPRSAERTALSARLDGVDGGRPFSVLAADVASAKATVTADRAEGSVRLAHARLHVPGLRVLSLVEVDTVTAKATCAAGKAPVATSHVLGSVTVLGKRVTLTAGGPADPQALRAGGTPTQRGRGERHPDPGRGHLRNPHTPSKSRGPVHHPHPRRKAPGRPGRGRPGRNGRQPDDPVLGGRRTGVRGGRGRSTRYWLGAAGGEAGAGPRGGCPARQ